MNIQTINSFLEKFWLVVGIGSLLYGIYFIYANGMEGNYMYLVYPIFAFVLYGFRRTMRIRMAKHNADKQAPS